MGICILIVAIIIFPLLSNKETVRHDYLFTGESEHWQGEYVHKGTDIWREKNKQITLSSESNYTMRLIYKGALSELASVKKMSYTYKAPHGNGSHTMEFDEPPTNKIYTDSGASTSSATINTDEVVEITVKWDTFEESFKLVKNGK